MDPILGNTYQEKKIAEISTLANELFPQIGVHLFMGMFRMSIRSALAQNENAGWQEIHRHPPSMRKAFFDRILEASRGLLQEEGLSKDEVEALFHELRNLNVKYWSPEEPVIYRSIGIIHSPHKSLEGMPIQPAAAVGIEGHVKVYPEFEDGLKDIEGFSHIILIYHFHRSEGFSLHAKPFLEDKLHGVFATRAPKRPNQIGLSVVELIERKQTLLHVENIDILDGTPLLDIKPYVPEFDHNEKVRVGWLADKSERIRTRRSDDRFV